MIAGSTQPPPRIRGNRAGYSEGVTSELRVVPVDDRAWLLAALADALSGLGPILPMPAELSESARAAIVRQVREAELPAGTAVVVHTSGSSGIPKAVALSAEALVASARATHEALGGPGQWLVTLPGNLISGLQMLVRGIVADTEPVFFDGPFDPEGLLRAAEEMDHPQRYVSVVPVQLARLIDLAERDAHAAEALRGFAAILVGGQAIATTLRQRAHELGLALRRSYGMTETAGGCVYDGVEIGDTRVRIREGEVQLSGSSLAIGYVGDDALTARQFVHDGDTRWYRTGDAGELLGGMLTVTGRIDRVVISGGVNVSLDEVERAAAEHRGWSSVVAIGVPHPEWGERVGLVVEIEAGAAGFDEVREAIRTRLGAAATPLWATETPELPRLTGGKPDRLRIAGWIGELRRSFAQVRAMHEAAGSADASGEAPESSDEVNAASTLGS